MSWRGAAPSRRVRRRPTPRKHPPPPPPLPPGAPPPPPMGPRSSLGPRAACFSPRHRGSHPSALLSPLLVLSAVLMLGGEAWPAPARVAILENVASVEVSAERGIVVSDPQSRRPHLPFPHPPP